jgi:hypothetical protein
MRDEGDSTERIEISDSAETSEIDPEPAPPSPPLVPEAAAPSVRKLIAHGWVEVLQAGALGFLVLLVVGSVLVLAAKLNFPSIGRGADFLGALNAIVIAGLGVLSVPVTFDGVTIAVLPLGALVAAGWGVAWAVRTTIRPPQGDAGAIIRYGARVAIPFALLCWFAALVFRIRGRHPVAADGGATLFIAAFWGALFGIVGALQTRRPLRDWAKALWNALRARAPIYDEGVFAGAATFVLVMVSSAAATLLWIIISLARDAPGRYFTVGDAIAYIVYLAALLPNAVISVATVAFGSAIDVGARLNLAGEEVGPLREYSLWAWGRGEPPGIVYALVLIPLVACIGGGLLARRRTPDPARMAPVLITSSAMLATTLTLFAWFAKMRLAGIGRGGGYALVAPDVVVTFIAAFLLAGVLGAVGWKLAESNKVSRVIGRR